MARTAVAVLLALIGPPIIVLTQLPPVIAELIYCALVVFVLFMVTRVERLPLSSIGIHKPTAMTFLWGLGLWLIGFVLAPLITRPLVDLVGRSGVDAGVAKLAATSMLFRIWMAVRGGVAEEILYRGYPIERLTTMTGRRWLAAFISIVAFALAHIPAWGSGFALTADLMTGIVLTLSYLWRRDLVANMLAHSLGLLVALVQI